MPVGRDDAGRPSRRHQDHVQLAEVVDLVGIEAVELEEREAGVLAPADVLRLHHRGMQIRTLGAFGSYLAAFARPSRIGSG